MLGPTSFVSREKRTDDVQKCTISKFLAFSPIAVTKSVIVVKSNEKAQDGEKDDNVACENEST